MPPMRPRRLFKIAHQVAGVIARRVDLDVHDRFEQRRPRARHAVLEGQRPGHLERQLVRVDGVERAVEHASRGNRPSDSRRENRAAARPECPFSTAGMNWRGIEPPKMSSTNSNSPPRGSGSNFTLQSPNWPWPPVCFLWRPCASVGAVIVSRYGIRGSLRFTSTPNRRFSFATVTSMCDCPWPASSSSFVCAITRVVDRRILLLQAMERRADLFFVAAALRLDRVRDHRLWKLDRPPA